MRWVLIVVLVAAPIVACTTSDDPELTARTTSTPLAAEAEKESATPTPDSDRAGRLAPGALVEGDPRWLMAPEEPTAKRLDGDCRSLADQGWKATCERLTTELGDAVWIRERRGQQERVSLYVHGEADAWELAWRATDDSGDEFDGEIVAADLAGDGNPEVVVMLTGVDLDAADQVPAPVEVAVVESTGEIVVHMVLRGGRSGAPSVTVRPGEGLEVKDCPFDCVPTSERRQRTVSYTPEGWRIIDTRPEERP